MRPVKAGSLLPLVFRDKQKNTGVLSHNFLSWHNIDKVVQKRRNLGFITNIFLVLAIKPSLALDLKKGSIVKVQKRETSEYNCV